MARELRLTTPLMHGTDVLVLQRHLAEHGYIRKADVDGKYGTITAQRAEHAQAVLGYPKPSKDIKRPDLLVAYLTGRKKPGPLMRALAKKRAPKKPRPAALSPGQRVVQVACSQLGQTEHPAESNRSKFSLWYGLIGAWCAMFVTWVFVTAKVGKSFARGRRYSYVPNIVYDARRGVNGMRVAPGPASGVVVCFDWTHDGIADHVGICVDADDLRRFAPKQYTAAVHAFGPLGPGDFWTVEGNTAVGNDSNGGIVMVRKRNRSLVQQFVHVN